MFTSKMTVIQLNEGDTILIRGGKTSFEVTLDSDRSAGGLILDNVPPISLINAFGVACDDENEDGMVEAHVAHEDDLRSLIDTEYTHCTIFF